MPPNGDEDNPVKEDYAIVIGIDDYPQLLPLNSSHNDAAAFAEWLLEPLPGGGGLKPKNLRLIVSPDEDPDNPIDPMEAEPVQKQIDKALRDFGVEKNRPIGRRLYFYFAGHGFGPKFDEVGMLMANAAMKRITSNIGLRKYNSFFHDNHLFDEVVFILDCCRDPGFATVETAAPGFNLDPPENGAPPSVLDYVVLAASYGEKAFAPLDKPVGERRGLLTKALLEALRGQTRAVDGLGRVTSASITDYVRTRVEELATEASLRQKPQVFRLPDPELVFAIHAKQVNVRIIAPAGLKGDLVVRNSIREIVARQSAELSTETQPAWEVPLLDVGSNYTVELEGGDLEVILKMDKVKGNGNVFRVPRPN
jgi:hypothetical protein